MKIHKEAALDFRESEVGEYLSLVNLEKLGDHLQLDYQLVVGEIRFEAAVDSGPVVDHWQHGLTYNCETLFQEFMAETCFIGRFEESNSKSLMNLYRASDHSPCQYVVIDVVRCSPPDTIAHAAMMRYPGQTPSSDCCRNGQYHALRDHNAQLMFLRDLRVLRGERSFSRPPEPDYP